MSISVVVRSHMTVTDTDAGLYVDTTDATRSYNGMDSTATLTSGTTPAATKWSMNQKALSTGTGTLDLTSLVGRTSDETVTGNTLKVSAIKLRCKSTNANAITVAAGASSGHPTLGASFLVVLQPGMWVEMGLDGVTAGTTVDNTHKNLDLTGTGSQVLEYAIIFG